MLDIFVMRHGQAELTEGTDEFRPLTAAGRVEVGRNVTWLSSKISDLDLVLVSPYTRALETLDVIKEQFVQPNRQAVVKEFIPAASAREAHDYIDAMITLYKPKNILIVSHMPLVSYLTESLTVDHQSPIFATGSVAHIKYQAAKMKGKLVELKLP